MGGEPQALWPSPTREVPTGGGKRAGVFSHLRVSEPSVGPAHPAALSKSHPLPAFSGLVALRHSPAERKRCGWCTVESLPPRVLPSAGTFLGAELPADLVRPRGDERE